MKRRGVISLLGGSLFSVSGCLRLSEGGGTGTGQQTATEGATTTATGSETATGTQAESTTADSAQAAYPMGLSEDGATPLLFSGHVRTLLQSSFRAAWTKFDVTNTEVMWQKEYDVDSGSALGRWTRRGGSGEVTIYRDGSEAFWREDMDDRVTYGEDAEGFDIANVTWAVEVKALLEVFSWGAPELVADSPAVWRVAATGFEEGATSPGHLDGELLGLDSAWLEVTEDGVIQAMEATYQASEPTGDELRVTSEYTVEGVGETSVPDPSWLADARENAPVVSASLTDDGRFCRLEIESGNRIEAGSRLKLTNVDTNDRTVVPLERPVEPGTPVYIYKDREEFDGFYMGGISRGSVPADVSPEPFDGSYEVSAVRKTTTYNQNRVQIP
ncbi:hypothetical protein [Haloarchaeobius sp. TZWSO28]|uniref:hypothetical protein n=1 Tax=Haloarchaeobius sp. TZWSO28 TaxID=3446119 RepID=UPI003EB90197